MNNEVTPEIRKQILVWVEGIPQRLAKENVSFQPDKKPGDASKPGYADWSGPAIKKLDECLRCWAKEKGLAGVVDPDQDIYAERVKTLSRKERGGQFFGSECWPDLAILRPIRIAIELDHGEHGKKVRDALTKASFNVLVGEWEQCYVLFFDETKDGRLKKDSVKGKERDILAAYEVLFRTKILFVPVRRDGDSWVVVPQE